jgi:putative hydrolase of the HAD superfamily
MGTQAPVWLFDLDDTLHDASHAAFGAISVAMTDYIVSHVGLSPQDASDLRVHYWQRYGATLLGLVRHHGVKVAHFLCETHRLPGLEQRLRSRAPDRAALGRLPGRKVVVTNAPRAYALRVLKALRLHHHFDALISIEDMQMWGQLRPKPDRRIMRYLAARLKTPTSRCVLVEDSLENQRAAHQVGMRAVWMQGYARSAKSHTKAGARPRGKPTYVHAKINSFNLLRLRTYALNAIHAHERTDHDEFSEPCGFFACAPNAARTAQAT